jgi:hypothetical protein
MPHQPRRRRRAAAWVLLCLAAALAVIGCGGRPSSPAAVQTLIPASPASSAQAFATSPAGQAARTDLTAFAKACVTAPTAAQPDPAAVYLDPGPQGHAARAAFLSCEKIPRHDLIPLGQCLAHYLPMMPRPPSGATEATHQRYDQWVIASADYCAQHVKGKAVTPPALPTPAASS